MALNTELETYKTRLVKWTAHEGKFVLIGSDQIVDFYSTYEDAIKVGYAKFRLTPFLVKQVNRLEPVRFVSRLVAPQSFRMTG